MHVSIVVFSPSGHTLKVAELFKQSLESHQAEVQLIDVTKQSSLLYEGDLKKNLQEVLKPHDLLMIGGPVYAGHVESNVLALIDRLPKPNDLYSDCVVPFVSYGGVHTSIALEEMGKNLVKGGRKSILGVKIAAEHTLTKTMAHVINQDLPGDAEKKVIENAVDEIVVSLVGSAKQLKDVSDRFKYASVMERIVFHLLKQEFFQKKHKLVSIDESLCSGCGICILKCPVNQYEKKEGRVQEIRMKSSCILCGECYHHCPQKAISFPYLKIAKKRLKDGKGHLETPQSAIYK